MTGCSTGFGRFIAEHLLEAGEKLVVTVRKTDKIANLEQKGDALIASEENEGIDRQHRIGVLGGGWSHAAYNAAKGGVANLTRSAACDPGKFGKHRCAGANCNGNGGSNHR